MIHWFFAAVTFGAVVVATFVNASRRAILALWIAGLGVGGIYLTLGAELLAIVQWIVSTLIAMSFMFFSVMFGEYYPEKKETDKNPVIMLGLTILLGGAFAAIVWLGSGELSEALLVVPKEGNDVAALGRALTGEHFLSLEVIALTLFVVLIGGGVIARLDSSRESTRNENEVSS